MKRNAEQEELPSGTCRETNIAEHSAGSRSGFRHIGQLPGVRVPDVQTSGYTEPDADDTPGKKCLRPNVGRNNVQKRSRSLSDSGPGLSWPRPAALRSLPVDRTQQDAEQLLPRKRRRLGKKEDEPYPSDIADLNFEPEGNGETMKTGKASNSVDRDIVDVLLEEWTVPVY